MSGRGEMSRTKRRHLRVSVAVFAYNEERNIRVLLRSLTRQNLVVGELAEVVVVTSGCTDRTNDEVQLAIGEDARIRLIAQPSRKGKANAINEYLRDRDPTADVLVLCGADLLLHAGTLDALVRPFLDDKIGMTGGRPVPRNQRGTLVGDIVHYLWDLHHDRALESPKLGELTAVRASLIQEVDEKTAVDEAFIEAVTVKQGFDLQYAPTAIVGNRGPETLRDFFAQRRRIAAGHFQLRRATGYAVSTMNVGPIVPLAASRFKTANRRTRSAFVVATAVEALARAAGYVDLLRGRDHSVWKMIDSSRRVAMADDEGAPAVSPAGARKGAR
jgi:poly-beta-1,6-N-acetyl-D-glucosamine synthase